jgi:hypothetical protein
VSSSSRRRLISSRIRSFGVIAIVAHHRCHRNIYSTAAVRNMQGMVAQ